MLLPVLIACQPAPEATPPVSLVVPLRWRRESGGLSWEEAEAGLAWSLTNLGALPPPDGWLSVVADEGDVVVFSLDLEAAGFAPQALPALTSAVTPMWQSDELVETGSVDVGRFLMRTLYAPWRYYSITGACGEFAQWSEQIMGDNTARYGVTVSLLTESERLVTLNDRPWGGVEDVGFVARSGAGVLWSGASEEVEVIDLMGNGQQRYAVFDGEGRLVPAADPAVIAAGQPGKCMWCHEGALMTGTPANPTTRPYLSYAEWMGRMTALQELQDAHRAGLETAADLVDRQAHTDGELLVRAFLRPTPERVAAEWGMTASEVAAVLEAAGVTATLDEEYPSRGAVLRRVEVDAVLAAVVMPGFVPLAVLWDDREAPEELTGLEGEAAAEILDRCWRP